MYRMTEKRCKYGHVMTPEDHLRGECLQCRTQTQERAREENAERAQMQLEVDRRSGLDMEALLAEFGVVLPADTSAEHRAWCERRVRERAGLHLRDCDREQLGRELEDMGTIFYNR